jgi:hypothetical protein
VSFAGSGLVGPQAVEVIAGGLVTLAGAIFWGAGTITLGAPALGAPQSPGAPLYVPEVGFVAGFAGFVLVMIGLVVLVIGMLERPKVRDMWPGHLRERWPPEPDRLDL